MLGAVVSTSNDSAVPCILALVIPERMSIKKDLEPNRTTSLRDAAERLFRSTCGKKFDIYALIKSPATSEWAACPSSTHLAMSKILCIIALGGLKGKNLGVPSLDSQLITECISLAMCDLPQLFGPSSMVNCFRDMSALSMGPKFLTLSLSLGRAPAHHLWHEPRTCVYFCLLSNIACVVGGLESWWRLENFSACALINPHFHSDLHFHPTPRAAHPHKSICPSWNVRPMFVAKTA